MRLFHIAFSLFALLLAASMQAQRDSSLTREFDRMSAKERARVAREEEAAALQDAVFQGHMQQGEEHFQAGHYNEALASYRQARSLRPLNVHPKVKIQDLEALIARRKEEAARSPIQVPVEPKPERPATSPPPATPSAPPRVSPASELGPQRSSAPPAAEKPPVVRSRAQLATIVAHDGTESVRTFREGRAVVEERVVREGERLVVWRKVVHPWGEVVHFRDNEPIPARRWQERFTGQ